MNATSGIRTELTWAEDAKFPFCGEWVFFFFAAFSIELCLLRTFFPVFRALFRRWLVKQEEMVSPGSARTGSGAGWKNI